MTNSNTSLKKNMFIMYATKPMEVPFMKPMEFQVVSDEM